MSRLCKNQRNRPSYKPNRSASRSLRSFFTKYFSFGANHACSSRSFFFPPEKQRRSISQGSDCRVAHVSCVSDANGSRKSKTSSAKAAEGQTACRWRTYRKTNISKSFARLRSRRGCLLTGPPLGRVNILRRDRVCVCVRATPG